MAFAYTLNKRVGLGGGLKVYVGTWTGNSGDAAGTGPVVEGGVVYINWWRETASAGPGQVIPASDAAGGTDGTRSITVYNNNNVTAGRFLIATL